MDLSLNQVTAILNTAADVRTIYSEVRDKYLQEAADMENLSEEIKSFKRDVIRSTCKAVKTLIESQASSEAAYLQYRAYCFAIKYDIDYADVLSYLRKGSLKVDSILNKIYWWEE